MRLLRRMRAEAALLIALADIGGVWPVTEVIRRQTALADAAVGAAVDYLLLEAHRRGRLKLADPTRPSQGSGYIVLAMGKMGSNELNYSSDIDLIVFYDADAPALVPGTEPGAFFVRLTRALVKLLQERTVDGYVFRTDLRLRPDPASTQIAISTAAALDYYESRGQNWERAALIKARPCAGDIAAGAALLKELSPFIWRKYLDFAAVADIHAMKRQIHAYRGHAEIAVEGHNIKLGRGGIREIEFFVQTQQLIAGGRHPELRVRETLATLDVLADGGWIDAAARDDLAAAYRFLRVIENRLQMVADEQTHTLPADRAALERFARFAGFCRPRRLRRRAARASAQRAASLCDAVRARAGRRGRTKDVALPARRRRPRDARQAHRDGLSPAARSVGAGAALERGRLSRRCAARSPATSSPRSCRSCCISSHAPPIPTPRSSPSTASWPALHGGGRLFSLLRQNPDLVALIALVLGTAPRLADSLAQFPDVMDAVIDPSFFGALPEEAELTAGLDRSLGQADLLRGLSRPHPHLRAGADVPDRDAHPLGHGLGRAGRRGVRAPRRCAHPLAPPRDRGELRQAARPRCRPGDRDPRARQARRARDDRDLRPRSHRHLRLRSRASGIERPAPALRQPVFLAPDATPDQRAHRADQSRAALPGRHAAAALGALRPARDPDRRLCELPGDRGLDLGAHGADARARGLGLAAHSPRGSRA